MVLGNKCLPVLSYVFICYQCSVFLPVRAGSLKCITSTALISLGDSFDALQVCFSCLNESFPFTLRAALPWIVILWPLGEPFSTKTSSTCHDWKSLKGTANHPWLILDGCCMVWRTAWLPRILRVASVVYCGLLYAVAWPGMDVIWCDATQRSSMQHCKSKMPKYARQICLRG